MSLSRIVLLVVLCSPSSLMAQGGWSAYYGLPCPGTSRDLRGWTPHPGYGLLSLWAENRAAKQPVLAFLGVSDRRWGRVPLPLDLSPLGLKGCRLYTGIQLTQEAISRKDGTVEMRWVVPNDPSLALAKLFGQMLGLNDPRVNHRFPLTTTSAVALTIGTVVPFTGLRISGNPTKATGAYWRYKSVDNNVAYDMLGKLWKPTGTAPKGGFPAVIISHGGHGHVDAYTTAIAQRMVKWGLVCIGANMTHVADLRQLGAPGGRSQRGGHPNDVLRARKCWEILKSLGYVNMTKVAAHGTSAGGFLTIAFAAAATRGELRVASHTASGIYDPSAPIVPSRATAAKIRIPYIAQHGDKDTKVPLSWDQEFIKVLTANKVPNRIRVWPGRGHGFGGGGSPILDKVLEEVRLWYKKYGLL